MKVFQITDSCPAFSQYKGCGKSILVTYDNIPTQLIYLPEDATIDNCTFEIKQNLKANSKAYFGMASCYEFVVEQEL